MYVVKEVKLVSIHVLPASAIKKDDISLLSDKSLSHKTITIVCLKNGVSYLRTIDLTGDMRVTMQAFPDMRVMIEAVSENRLRIHGVGLTGLKAPIAPINIH